MPIFRIKILNDEFSANEERDLPNAEAARQEAIRGAVAIGSERLCAGAVIFGAEVTVTEVDHPRRRFVVTVGASPLMRDEPCST